MPKLPSVVSQIPRDLKQFVDRVREAIAGEGWDRLITARDLRNAGLVDNTGSGTTLTPPGQVYCGTPPAPTGLAASGAFENILLTWDSIAYPCHAFTEVWASGTDNIGTAVQVGMTSGLLFAHAVGGSATRYYWIRFRNTQDQVGPYNAVGGTLGQTETNPAYMLDVLAGAITESQLYDALNDRIDLIDGPDTTPGTIAYEAAQRALAISAEATARANAVTAEANARIEAVTTETNARVAAVTAEANARIADVQDMSNTALQSLTAISTTRDELRAGIAQARFELTEYVDDGVSAEATARLALKAQLEADDDVLTAAVLSEQTARVDGDGALSTRIDQVVADVGDNAAAILIEQTARADADSAMASQIDGLTATVDGNTAAIAAEQVARADGDDAEATSREALAAQILGADGTSNTSGLIYTERNARVAQDEALSQQITLLSAGAGETFDFSTIWYFDTGVDNWTGNGTPTASAGWLRPADAGSDPYVISPDGLDSDGAKYTQVRIRIRKTGTPTWDGYLWWQRDVDSTWDAARRVTLDEPSFGSNGISVLTINPAWTGTIDQIRVDLSTAQTGTDYFEIDWVALGRPAPGASTASVFELEQAVVQITDEGDVTSIAYQLNALESVVENPTTGGTNLANAINSKYTTTTADAAIANRESAIAARYGTAANKTFRQASAPVQGTTNLTTQTGTVTVNNLYDGDLWIDTDDGNKVYRWLTGSWVESPDTSQFGSAAFTDATENYLANGEGAFITQIQDTVASVNDPTTGLTAAYATASNALGATVTLDAALVTQVGLLSAAIGDNSAAISSEQTARTDADNALSSQVDVLSATVDDNTAAIVAEQEARAAADGVFTRQGRSLVAAEGDFANIELQTLLVQHNQQIELRGAFASVLNDTWANTQAGLAAEAGQRTELAAIVNSNVAAITSEQIARADADSALSQSIEALSVEVDANAANITTLETAKIGYCTLAGAATDHTNRTTCEAAGGTWNVGLPFASAVKQVSISDGATTAAIETLMQSHKDELDGLSVEYYVKGDVNGNVFGFGLVGDEANSEFIANVDTFAVTPPDASLPLRANSTTYAEGKVVKISGITTQMFVCKVAGTTASSPPTFTGKTLGDLIVDGSVTWQTASRVPFAVTTVSKDVNGVTVPPSVYIDGAMVVQATINNAQIADLAVDDSKITNVSVTKLTAGTLQATEYIDVGVNDGKFRLDGGSRSLVIKDDSNVTRFSASPSGIGIYGPNGETYLTSGSGVFNSSITNMIAESEFLTDKGTWGVQWQQVAGTNYSVERDLAGSDWMPKGMHQIGCLRSGTTGAASGIVDLSELRTYPVVVGQHYQVSAYVAAHRCTVQVGLHWFDASGAYLSEVGSATSTATGGTNITGWDLRYVNSTAPANAAFVRFSLRGSAATSANPYFWGTRFMLCEVPSADTGYVPWKPHTPGVITANNVSTYIASAAITNAYIGDFIQSSNYVAGSAGWYLDKTGVFDVNSVNGSRLSMGGAAGSVVFKTSGGSTTFSVDTNGNAVFSGSLNAATGTFAGTLAAGVLNSSAFDALAYSYSNAGTHSLTVPNMKSGWTAMHMRITLQGAGGGGGGGGASGGPNSNPWSTGGGGGAGQKNVYVLTSGFSPGNVLTIVVGAGGAGGAGDNINTGDNAANPGASGAASSVSYGWYYSAAGGGGGGGGTKTLADGNTGGAGGALGGQSGVGGATGAVTGGSGGQGGTSAYGAGGVGGGYYVTYAGAGASGGAGAGGGGGGAGLRNSDSEVYASGGAGGQGYVLIEFFDPNTVVLNTRYSALIQWLDTVGHGAVPSNAR